MTKRVQVTQEQAEALNAHQGKMQAASVALHQNFAALAKSSEADADLERLAREVSARGNLLGEPFATSLQEVRRFQAMLAEEISSGIGAVLRNREKLREVLRVSGLLEASETGSMDDVEIVVGVSNPPFSQTPANG